MLEVSPGKKAHMDMEALTRLKKSGRILLYGTGSLAAMLLPQLFLLLDRSAIAGFVVSQMPEGAPETFQGFPVSAVNAVRDRNETVLVATAGHLHQEIGATLSALGFTDVLFCTPELRNALAHEVFQIVFAEHHVRFDRDSIDIAGARFINPLTLPSWYAILLYDKIFGIVLPMVTDKAGLLGVSSYEDAGMGVTLTAGDVVLDCGANLGVFSVYAASRGCRVYAFEPNQEVGEYIRGHSALNGGRIELVQAALSDVAGTIDYYVNDAAFCNLNTIMGSRERSGHALSIPATTVDEFVQERGLSRLDFIKADIEGAERLMLQGARRSLRRFTPKLSLYAEHFADDPEVLGALIREANPAYTIRYDGRKLRALLKRDATGELAS